MEDRNKETPPHEEVPAAWIRPKEVELLIGKIGLERTRQYLLRCLERDETNPASWKVFWGELLRGCWGERREENLPAAIRASRLSGASALALERLLIRQADGWARDWTPESDAVADRPGMVRVAKGTVSMHWHSSVRDFVSEVGDEAALEYFLERASHYKRHALLAGMLRRRWFAGARDARSWAALSLELGVSRSSVRRAEETLRELSRLWVDGWRRAGGRPPIGEPLPKETPKKRDTRSRRKLKKSRMPDSVSALVREVGEEATRAYLLRRIDLRDSRTTSFTREGWRSLLKYNWFATGKEVKSLSQIGRETGVAPTVVSRHNALLCRYADAWVAEREDNRNRLADAEDALRGLLNSVDGRKKEDPMENQTRNPAVPPQRKDLLPIEVPPWQRPEWVQRLIQSIGGKAAPAYLRCCIVSEFNRDPRSRDICCALLEECWGNNRESALLRVSETYKISQQELLKVEDRLVERTRAWTESLEKARAWSDAYRGGIPTTVSGRRSQPSVCQGDVQVTRSSDVDGFIQEHGPAVALSYFQRRAAACSRSSTSFWDRILRDRWFAGGKALRQSEIKDTVTAAAYGGSLAYEERLLRLYARWWVLEWNACSCDTLRDDPLLLKEEPSWRSNDTLREYVDEVGRREALKYLVTKWRTGSRGHLYSGEALLERRWFPEGDPMPMAHLGLVLGVTIGELRRAENALVSQTVVWVTERGRGQFAPRLRSREYRNVKRSPLLDRFVRKVGVEEARKKLTGFILYGLNDKRTQLMHERVLHLLWLRDKPLSVAEIGRGLDLNSSEIGRLYHHVYMLKWKVDKWLWEREASDSAAEPKDPPALESPPEKRSDEGTQPPAPPIPQNAAREALPRTEAVDAFVREVGAPAARHYLLSCIDETVDEPDREAYRLILTTQWFPENGQPESLAHLCARMGLPVEKWFDAVQMTTRLRGAADVWVKLAVREPPKEPVPVTVRVRLHEIIGGDVRKTGPVETRKAVLVFVDDARSRYELQISSGSMFSPEKVAQALFVAHGVLLDMGGGSWIEALAKAQGASPG